MRNLFKFSIVIPLFNKEAYIKETIDSVKDQTFPNWQLVIVDDGSTDTSYEIAKSCIDKSASADNIKLLKRSDFVTEKRGGSICRNIGIEQSDAEYIIFLDADDVLLPFCLEERNNKIKEESGFNFYVFNVAYCKGINKEVYMKERPGFVYRLQYLLAFDKRKFFLYDFLKANIPWHTSGPVWDRQFLIHLGGFNADFERLQDPEIHTRALMQQHLKIKYFMNDVQYDALHRTDDDRIVFDELVFFKNRIMAIKKYINYFSNLMIEKNDQKLLKKLRGFLILGETMAYRSIRGVNDRERVNELKSLTKEIYDIRNKDLIVNASYMTFMKLYRFSFNNKVLTKFKVPGMLLLAYKKTV